jgi:hypothetical protein
MCFAKRKININGLTNEGRLPKMVVALHIFRLGLSSKNVSHHCLAHPNENFML